MEEDKEFQIKILTEIMKKQQELINNIFNIVEKDYIKKSKFEEDEAVIEEMAKQLAGLAIFDDNIENALILGDKEEVIEYFTNKVKEKKNENKSKKRI